MSVDLECALRLESPLPPGGRKGRAFGGALLARLLVAATPHAHDSGRVHSVHATFLRPADPGIKTLYDVHVLRASRRFTTVRVDASHAGRTGLVATASVSFHTPEETSEHGPPPRRTEHDPEARPPASGGPIPAPDAPIRAPFDLRAGTTAADFWLRLRHPLDNRPALHAAALLWASDFALTRVADLEHEGEPGVRQAASLDHSAWFHRDVDLSDWLHYEITSPVYREGLALSTGTLTDRCGLLVATVAQESLLRRT